MSNLDAFLAMIRRSEGTDKAPNAYAVTFDYHFTITDFSDHPAVLGTWKGERLPDKDCIALGLAPPCHSSAAGAYQFTRPTWLGLKSQLKLPDFSPASQDEAATLLITQAGALHLVESGQIVDAIAKCSGIWASLPGSLSGQPQAKTADLIQAYTSSGGAFA
jgi:muramidase (phage lysozyme)